MAYENLDAELLNELQGDGRATLNDLADRLDVSVTTISNHLNDLEDAGVIEGYSPDINYEAIGYDVTAIIRLKTGIDSVDDVSETLADAPSITAVYDVTGDYDIEAVGKFRSVAEMESNVKDLLQGLDIQDSNTSVAANVAVEGDHMEIDEIVTN